MNGKSLGSSTANTSTVDGNAAEGRARMISNFRPNVDKTTTMCSRPGCNQKVSFAWEIANRRPVCAAHARPMEPCGSVGCRRKASHGFRGSRKLEFCVEHAADGMVNLRTKRCSRQGCFKIPTYGVEGSTHREFCAPHAPSNYININSQKCVFEGCAVEASFGIGGSGPRKLCAQHCDKNLNIFTSSVRRVKPDSNGNADTDSMARTELAYLPDMAQEEPNVLDRKQCAYVGCSRRRSHGIKGTAKPQFCHEHADKGMVNVEIQRCDSRGCAKLAKFGVRGSNKREFCAHHAAPEMVRDGGTGTDLAIAAAGEVRKSHERGAFAGDSQSSGGENDTNDAKRAGKKRTIEDDAYLDTSYGEVRSMQPGRRMSDDDIRQKATRPWPGFSILQTQTGWSKWNWPSSLSSCTM